MKKTIGILTLLAASAGALMTPAVAAAEVRRDHAVVTYQTDNRARFDNRREKVVVKDVRARTDRYQPARYDARRVFDPNCR